jgi:sugar phosphate isomerase/epimerase
VHITGVCINADGGRLNGSLERLKEDLTFFENCGFDGVELSAHGLDLIVGGRLHQPQLDRVRAIVDRFDLTYTVHAPDRLNLAFPQRMPGCASELPLEKKVFVACLDACAALGAKVMVYHSGLIALHQVAYGLGGLPDDGTLERARDQEVNALRELLPLAAERGVVVAMENRDPHPWEVAALMRAGAAVDQLLTYHAGMSIPALVRQVEAVDHPSFGLTLDLGHLYIAAHVCGFDYLAAIRQAAPYVRHLHSSDNFGRLGGVFDELHFRIPYGDGDVHLPHGWGTLPHADALAQLPGYEGLYVIEIRSRFREYLAETLDVVRAIIGQAVRGQRSPGS